MGFIIILILYLTTSDEPWGDWSEYINKVTWKNPERLRNKLPPNWFSRHNHPHPHQQLTGHLHASFFCCLRFFRKTFLRPHSNCEIRPRFFSPLSSYQSSFSNSSSIHKQRSCQSTILSDRIRSLNSKIRSILQRFCQYASGNFHWKAISMGSYNRFELSDDYEEPEPNRDQFSDNSEWFQRCGFFPCAWGLLIQLLMSIVKCHLQGRITTDLSEWNMSTGLLPSENVRLPQAQVSQTQSQLFWTFSTPHALRIPPLARKLMVLCRKRNSKPMDHPWYL